MEITKKDMKILKGVAILFMLLLHLFARKEENRLYETFPEFNGVPLIYYLGLFGDACVPIYCFASGYGLFMVMNKDQQFIVRKNFLRVFKLLINFWIILLIFVLISFSIGKADYILGSLTEFLLNFFVLSNSYNGAWWFLQTYIFLVILSPILIRLIKKYNSITLLLASGIIYLLSYVQRIKQVFDFGENDLLNLFVTALVLFGTSQLPYIVGSIFAKEKIYSKLYSKYNNLNYKNIFCALGIFSLVIIHSIFETMFIAPFTAIAFICLFNLLDKTIFIQKVFILFGNHSTNIWLTHMFFYITFLSELTFAPRYPVLIFFWLLLLCLITSYVINLIYQPIIQFIDKRIVSSGTDLHVVRNKAT
ncbi:acyltransferase family protein [Metabacillus litoralis]|uniref:acyltransferase family protein n=1 Tax=Metabacillus litoralis TaxID=152268 RepID=UPI00203B76BF|nr:acyltransferase family protein [Metabacillus litoralis]MCM3650414.1 acyltransferase [Metabacillus litoralis]